MFTALFSDADVEFFEWPTVPHPFLISEPVPFRCPCVPFDEPAKPSYIELAMLFGYFDTQLFVLHKYIS